MTKTWCADKLFPYLKKFYTEVEQITKSKFFYPLPIYRPFLSIAEQNDWMGESTNNGFVKQIFTTSQYDEVHDEYGGLLLDHCGYINTSEYMASVRSWLLHEGGYREEHFDRHELEVADQGVSYKDCEASIIVFCDGIKCLSNPHFSWLPVRPLKGETLLVEAKFFDNVLVNRGVYMVPDGQDRWRIGSTYQYQFETENITLDAKLDLTRNLESLLRIDYKVIGQYAGIRPVTPDRRPIIGKHPAHPTVLIFNGMGTKGVSLSPYFSEVLVRSLYESIGINKEVDINRYKSLYWNSR